MEVPRLPGHGTRWQDLNQVAWTDWYAEVERALDRLRADHRRGRGRRRSRWAARVALRLAEERGADVAGLVLVNPFVSSTRTDLQGAAAAQARGPLDQGRRQRHQEARPGRGRLPAATAQGAGGRDGHVAVGGARPAQGHPAAALLPLRGRPRHRRLLEPGPSWARSAPATSRSGSSTTATTWPRSTTTRRGSSRRAPSSSRGSPTPYRARQLGVGSRWSRGRRPPTLDPCSPTARTTPGARSSRTTATAPSSSPTRPRAAAPEPVRRAGLPSERREPRRGGGALRPAAAAAAAARLDARPARRLGGRVRRRRPSLLVALLVGIHIPAWLGYLLVACVRRRLRLPGGPDAARAARPRGRRRAVCRRGARCG